MADANIETVKDFNSDDYILTFKIRVSNSDMNKLDLSLLRELSEAIDYNCSVSRKFNVLERLFKALGK